MMIGCFKKRMNKLLLIIIINKLIKIRYNKIQIIIMIKIKLYSKIKVSNKINSNYSNK